MSLVTQYIAFFHFFIAASEKVGISTMPPKKTATKKSAISPKGKITGFFAPKPSPKVTKHKQTDDVATADFPPAKRVPKDDGDGGLTVEQQDQIAHKKLEAETKLLAKKLGVDRLDSSWVEALHLEFKKPYFTEVLIPCMSDHVSILTL